MTAQQYQKRIWFLEYVKNNYVPKNKDSYLIFYFENYDLKTLRVVAKKKGEKDTHYFDSRCDTDDGAILMSYFEDYLRLDFQDRYLDIIENLTTGSVLMNNLVETYNFEEVKKELRELLKSAKTE